MKIIGERIRNYRVALGLSQAATARMLNISNPAFCKIENGQTDLNISRLLQIAEVLKVPVARLISGDTDKEDGDDKLITDLRAQLTEKEEELNKLRKKIIDLYDKLGM